METNLNEEGKETKLNNYAAACAVVASVISIIFGYDTGVMSGAMIFIKEDLKVDDTQVEVLAGILNLWALVGSLAAGRTSDYIGRRLTIMIASILFMLGSILMGYGPSYAILMVGRCIAGLGVGFALMIAPVYTSEISAAAHRGKLSSLPELCISVGILIGYVINYFFGKLSLKVGWRLMLGVAAIPSLALGLGILRMPESPRWLVMKGRLEDAKRVLHLVSNSEREAELKFTEITKTQEEHNEGKHSEANLWKEILIKPTRGLKRVLLAAIGIHFFEHAAGVEAVILYSPRIFKAAGITQKSKLLLATVGVGVTKTVFILAATYLLDRVGRRPLLLISVGGAGCALLALGIGLTIADHAETQATWALALAIVATYVYITFYSIGLSPITWVYTSEIFPLKFRAIGAGIGVAVNRCMNAAVSMSFISIYRAITIGGAFFMFAGMATLAWLFFYFFLPETKGKSLEEIELMFDNLSKSSNGMDNESNSDNGKSPQKW